MIQSSITTELQSLQAQVNAARPLNQASFPTIKALQLNAGNLVIDIQTALVAPSTLDTWVAPVDVGGIISGVNAAITAGEDQNQLSLLRGITGRVASNLDQLV
jgi:hypothetical protein